MGSEAGRRAMRQIGFLSQPPWWSSHSDLYRYILAATRVDYGCGVVQVVLTTRMLTEKASACNDRHCGSLSP